MVSHRSKEMTEILWISFKKHNQSSDRLRGVVVRVPGYRSRGPGFDSWFYQIF
jgi:hypothetical protein